MPIKIPRTLSISFHDICQLSCSYCPRSVSDFKTDHGKWMSIQDFKIIIDDFLSNVSDMDGLPRFSCCPFADVFAGGEKIFPYLEYLFDRFQSGYFITNGIGLTDNIQHFLSEYSNKIEFISISDHVKKEDFIPNLLKSMNGKLITKIGLGTLVDFDPGKNNITTTEKANLSLPLIQRQLHSWSNAVRSNQSSPNYVEGCKPNDYTGWNAQVVIDVNGNVRMCCHDWGHGEKLPNALEKKIKQIWCVEMNQLDSMLKNPGKQKQGLICHTCPFSIKHTGVPKEFYIEKYKWNEAPVYMESDPCFVIITCMNREEHLLQSLPYWIGQTYPSTKIVVVDYSSDNTLEHSLRNMIKKYPYSSFSNGVDPTYRSQVTLLRYENMKEFNMSHANNLGIRTMLPYKREERKFLVATADSIPKPHYVEMVMNGLSVPNRYTRSYCGIIGFRHSQWININGYNEFISGYGGEDVDFAKRLDSAGYECSRIHDRNMDIIIHDNNLREQNNPNRMTTKDTNIQNWVLIRKYASKYGWRGNFGHMGGNSHPIEWKEIQQLYLHISSNSQWRKINNFMMTVKDHNYGMPMVMYKDKYIMYFVSTCKNVPERLNAKTMEIEDDVLGWTKEKLEQLVTENA